MNICKLSDVIISLRYTQSLSYSKFLMCWLYWYEFTLRFASIRERVSLNSNLLLTLYCTLFFLLVFPWVSHIKFLIRQYQHNVMSYHPFFPLDFWWMIHRDNMHCTLFLCEFSLWCFSYKVFDEAMPTQKYMLYHLFSPTGVFGRWYLKHIIHMVKVLLDYDFGFI